MIRFSSKFSELNDTREGVEREAVIVPPRRSLTHLQRMWILNCNDSVCHLCGCRIAYGQPFECDHVEPRFFTGSDLLKEYKPAHVECHAVKTSTQDIPRIAKTRAMAKLNDIEKGRAPTGKIQSRPLDGGRDGRLRKRMNGKVESR